MQAGIDALTRWVAEWHITLNLSKTVHMLFGHNKIDHSTFLFDRNSPIETLNGHKDLRVWWLITTTKRAWRLLALIGSSIPKIRPRD